eukprot:s3757_g4.t1
MSPDTRHKLPPTYQGTVKLLEHSGSATNVGSGGVWDSPEKRGTEVAQLLLQSRADIDRRVQMGGPFRFLEFGFRSYLRLRSCSSKSQYRNVVGLWFSEGGGASPLAIASFCSNESFIEFLLSARAQIDVRNHRGHCAMDLARHASTRRCLQLAQVNVEVEPQVDVLEEEMISVHF